MNHQPSIFAPIKRIWLEEATKDFERKTIIERIKNAIQNIVDVFEW